MDKANIANTFTNCVGQLRNTECSRKDKITCFQSIAECIISPAMLSHQNYNKYCSAATNVLLLFCEDLDSTVRMSAEENLNRIFRSFERTRATRIPSDLYNEIKRNGNQRSLRICLNLFAYYSPQIPERRLKWYAIRMSSCLQIISQRKETMLCETLCEFVKNFSQHLQMGLTDSETFKLIEVFMDNLNTDCIVKRRCSAQNCISLIKKSRNKGFMAKHGLSKVIELLRKNQQTPTILGSLGLLRLLLPLIIHGFDDDCWNDESDYSSIKKSQSSSTGGAASDECIANDAVTDATRKIIKNECIKIIEIFDYCLHLLSTTPSSNHSIINASLDVINAILQAVETDDRGEDGNRINGKQQDFTLAKCLNQLLRNQQLPHNEYLRSRKSLKNQIFRLKNYEKTSVEVAPTKTTTTEMTAAEEIVATKALNHSIITSGMTTKTAASSASNQQSGNQLPAVSTVERSEAVTSSVVTTKAYQGKTKLEEENNYVNKDLEKHETGVVRIEQKKKIQQQEKKDELELQIQEVLNEKTILQENKAEAATISANREWAENKEFRILADEGKNYVTDDVDAKHKNDKLYHSGDEESIENFCIKSHIDNDDSERHSKTLSTKQYESIESNKNKTATGFNKPFGDDANDGADVNDDFTTLCGANEPIGDVVNVTDANDKLKQRHNVPPAVPSSSSLVFDEQQLQNLSDIDNESFNSIDFETEIKIVDLSVRTAEDKVSGDVNVLDAVTENCANVIDVGNVIDNGSSPATFGSFFNSILTHTNTESMTKLFRPTLSKSTTTKSTTISETNFPEVNSTETLKRKQHELDGISINSSISISPSAAETISIATSNNEEMPSTNPLMTASATSLLDTNTESTKGNYINEIKQEQTQHTQAQQNLEELESPKSEASKEGHRRGTSCRMPNVNPFLKNPPLKQDISIGSINEQSVIFYAGRLIVSRFLLTGQPGGLQSDVTTRVSIKNLSLSVLSQCVRLEPNLLTLTLEINSYELQCLERSVKEQQASTRGTLTSSSSQSSSKAGSPAKTQSDTSSNLDADYEHVDIGSDAIGSTGRTKKSLIKTTKVIDDDDQSLLLEIKDDHFGVSSSDYFLNQQLLSRSVDTASLSAMSSSKDNKQHQQHNQQQMSQSQIIGREQIINVAKFIPEDTVPPKTVPLPPVRTKSLRKRSNQLPRNNFNDTIISNEIVASAKNPVTKETNLQHISDVLLFYKHPDPILRGGVQQIIGNFIEASNSSLKALTHLPLNLILAILLKGLEDDIHTVIIQALNAFDKIFPFVLANYLSRSRICSRNLLNSSCFCPCHHEELQHEQFKQSSTISDIYSSRANMKNDNVSNSSGSSTKNSCSSKDIKDVLRKKLDCITSCSCSCKGEIIIDNDELIGAILNSFQLKVKSDVNVSYLNDVHDNTGPHVNAGLNNERNIGNRSTTTSAAKTSHPSSEEAGSFGPNNEIASKQQYFSLKFLLDKLRLCQKNKYWLVQNKYAEVITNLNYFALHEYYCDDKDLVTTYEQIFLNELLQLIGEDDFRVREHAAECICKFIIQNAKYKQQIKERQQQNSQELHSPSLTPSSSSSSSLLSWPRRLTVENFLTNFNLLWDFLDYRLFSGMSPPLRNIFTVNSAISPPLTTIPPASTTPSAAPSTKVTPTITQDMNCNRYLAFNIQRQMKQEERLLAGVLYHFTNKLMDLNDKNSQFGIIHALRTLLKYFNFMDFHRVWTECNILEICLKFLHCNQATAVDLNCQNDLIDVVGKLMAGSLLTNPKISQIECEQLIDSFLTHIMKILNIYYHIVAQQKPLLLAKTHKQDLFSNTKEVVMQKWGYFGSEYVYIKLYSLLKSAYDIYKMTITQTSGSILLSLLYTCINNLNLCIEMRAYGINLDSSRNTKINSNNLLNTQDSFSHVPPITSTVKLVEEILQYLKELIHLATVECIACLRQLLKYLFTPNDVLNTKVMQQVFKVRTWPLHKYNEQQKYRLRQWQQNESLLKHHEDIAEGEASPLQGTNSRFTTGDNIIKNTEEPQHLKSDDWKIFGDLIACVSVSSPFDTRINYHTETAKYIRIFEPVVVKCIARFIKTNAVIQASILELISDMLELHITYSTPDSKNIIFHQIINNLELIESGVARNGQLVVPSMIKFLVQLTKRSDKLITMPKVISIINNLLANNAIRGCAITALKSLAYEIFFGDREQSALAVAQSNYQRSIFQSPLNQPSLVRSVDQHYRQPPPIRNSEEAAAVAEVLLQINRELDTQKEVVLGMLEKFIDANECQHVLGLLMLRQHSVNGVTSIANNGLQQEQHQQGSNTQQILENPDAVFGIVCRAVCEERICISDWSSFLLLETFFRNCDNLVLTDSKLFHMLFQWFITKDLSIYNNLSCATIILDNVILKTEEIYLINHIKLYLENHKTIPEVNRTRYLQDIVCLSEEPSTSLAAAAASTADSYSINYNSCNPTSDINEMNFFANILNEKLAQCFLKLSTNLENLFDEMDYICPETKYCGIAVRFIRALRNICCCSRLQDALQPGLRLVLNESGLLEKYYRFLKIDEDLLARSGEDSLLLQLEIFRLLFAVRLLDTSTVLKKLQASDIKPDVRKALLREICKCNQSLESCGLAWSLQQVRQLFHPAFLNILICDNFPFICIICEVDEEFYSAWLDALIENYAILGRNSIRILVHSSVLFCTRNSSTYCIAKFLSLLVRLYHISTLECDLENLIERTARWMISSAAHRSPSAVYDSFIRVEDEESERQHSPGFVKLQNILLNDLGRHNLSANLNFEQKIIDEKWLFSQIIKYSSQSDCDPDKIVRILLDIQSEHKLHTIFNSIKFNKERLLVPAITWSLQAMLTSFRNSCIQHNPHIHYLQPNPLARVSCAILMARIDELTLSSPSFPSIAQRDEEVLAHLAESVLRLMEALKCIEATALIYIEAKFIEKFLREHLLRPNYVASLLRFLHYCSCILVKGLLNLSTNTATSPTAVVEQQSGIEDGGRPQKHWIYLRCIDVLLKQKLIWNQLHRTEGIVSSTSLATSDDVCILSPKQRHKLLCSLVELLMLAARKPTQTERSTRLNSENMDVIGTHEILVRGSPHKHDVYLQVADDGKSSKEEDNDGRNDDNNTSDVILSDVFPSAAFVAKLIETQIDNVPTSGTLSSAYLFGGHEGRRIGSGATPPERAGASYSMNNGGLVEGIENCASTTASSILHADDYFACIGTDGTRVPMNLLISIGISVLRVSQFYAFAVTPLEIVQQQQRLQQQQQRQQQQQHQTIVNSVALGSASGSSRIPDTPTKHQPPTESNEFTETKANTTKKTTICTVPTIPVESLSDVAMLRSFIKRLSIFGFVSRQQFEEHFMTLLLLINKVYDENLVDQQEQFQIKSICLEAILELLITYKTFPIVGDKLSRFHHTTRWPGINCDSISLKKLHKIQLIVSESNIFYHPNLERQLVRPANTASSWLCSLQDNIKGTKCFLTNQMDLSFVWQMMESSAETTIKSDEDKEILEEFETGQTLPSGHSLNNKSTSIPGSGNDVSSKNYIYFTTNSGVDFKSSSQLIFDVMMQIIEYNHILVLPNLVKFCEICENRDQIKWIKDKALKMQEAIPIDDTISHQHIIYLLCRTQATLIPTLNELQQLCILIANYLRSSHVFIRNATLAGILSLLECCSKTNTSIGKLSEELALLRELIVNYIQRHGLIEQSSIRCSTTHSKLVWTLTFALIECTSKFLPHCNLLSNAIITAGQLLPKTPDEEIYLCILHGLERLIVIGGTTGNNKIVSPELHHKIEKLAIDLVKLENEKFSVPALKLLLSCMYIGSAEQLENTELSNGIVQDDPEIIAQQTDKVDVLLHCIKLSSRNTAWIYGQVLCQIIRDLVPPNEILTKVIKEFLAINQPHCDIIATVVYQVFRSAIDSSFLEMLQDWLICSLPTFLALPLTEGVWRLSVIFLSASINLHLIKLFPVVLGARESFKLGQHEIALFVTAAQDFHAILSPEQKMRFRDAFHEFQQNQIYAKMLQSL